jgi:PIN domain nuclease of toxin-antitoxin system
VRLLLDTHIWLWSLLEPGKLAKRVAGALQDGRNEIWLSPISVWEFLVLVEKGRVILQVDAASWLDEALARAPLKEAALTHEIARQSRLVTLPHQDPADRFLAATAKVLGLTLVTADGRFRRSRGLSLLHNRARA